MGEPLMRVSHMQSNVEALRDLGAVDEARVREAAADQVLAIEQAVRVAWLPVELDLVLTEAVEAVCGEQRLRRWGRDAIAKSGDGPLLRPFVNALQRVGLTPHAALKRVPYGWNLVYKDCGKVRYERVGDTEALLVHEGAPELMCESAPYLVGIAGSFDGVMQIVGGRGCHARAEVVEPGVVHYPCRWSRAAG